MADPDGPSFAFRQHRIDLEVLSPVYFPPYKAENVLRGMAGLLIPQAAPELADRILHPRWPGGPSGFATPPKPFVVRAHHLDGRRFQPGEPLHFDVIQFDLAIDLGGAFAAACRMLETEGLGPGRGRLRFLQIEANSHRLSLLPVHPATQATLRFVSPAEIDRAFGILIARLHARINALSTCYGGHPPLPRLAPAAVELTRDATQMVDRRRLSTRTGQSYETGGRIGELDYVGDLTESLPYLQAGQWTGIGNGTFELAK